jgi:hypothetical protein
VIICIATYHLSLIDSQRYPRAPPPIETKRGEFAVAFDFLSFLFPSQMNNVITVTEKLTECFSLITHPLPPLPVAAANCAVVHQRTE